MVSLHGCQRSTSGPGELPKELLDVLPEGAKRPVEVVLTSPRGEMNELEPAQSIVIGFNQPMVPLRPISADVNVDFVEILPKVEGRFRWKGTATLVFEPKTPLAYSTRYKVRVKQGVKSWSGQSLAKDFNFDFLTPTVGLAHSLPIGNSEMQGKNDPLYLHFNQPVQAADVQGSLELRQGSKTIPVEVRAYTEEDRAAESKAAELQDAYGLPRENGVVTGKAEHALVVIPKQPLAPGEATELLLKPGLKSPAGPEISTSERSLQFTSRRAFALNKNNQEAIDPEAGLNVSFTSPVNQAELYKHLQVNPKVEIPEVEGGDETSYDAYFGGELKPNTEYTVKITGDIKDRFGETLSGPKEIKFRTRDFEPQIWGPEGAGVLELHGKQSIPLGIRNQTSVPVRMSKLTPAQAIEVFQASNALYSSNPYTPPGGFQKTWDLGGNKGRNAVEQRELALPGGGIYYLQVGERMRSLVTVSDVGLTLKSSPEQLLVYATTLKDAGPVAGAEVEVYDKSGVRLWSGKTDAEGFCQAPGWAGLKVPKKEWENPAVWVALRHGGSQSLANANGYNGVSPGSAGVEYEYDQLARTFKAFAFCERGLYKPGETIQLKGSLRELSADSWKLPDLKSVVYKVFDSRDKEIGKGELQVNRFGGFDQSVALKESAPTGTYRVEYSLPKTIQDNLKGSGELTSVSFQVEAFKPAQFEVTVRPDQKNYVMGDKAKVELKGWYLFGAPMNGQPMEWSARLEPTTLRPDGFEGYDFGLSFDSEEHQDESKLLSSGNTTLNEQGLIEQSIQLDNIPYRGSAQLVIEGTAVAANRQRLSGRTSIPLHRGEVQIGVRHDGFFAEAGKSHKIEAVAVLPDGQTKQAVDLKVELLRRQWNSVRKADVTGAYRWVSEVKDESVHSQDVRTSTSPVAVDLTPPKAGYYVVRVSTEDSRKNKIVTESGFYASGNDYVSWWRGDEDVVELVADKKKYKPGDTATVMIKSPYEKCRALVTLERDRVIERRVVELNGTAPTIQVPLSSRHLPNVYVSVMLLRGRQSKADFGPDGQDLSKPSFKVGYVNLPVEPTEKKLNVKVKLDKEKYQPGDEVVADFEVTDQQGNPVEAELSVAVPDQGVLSLIGYELPDWFQVFYGPRALRVATSETRSDVIGQRAYGAKGANPGGGGGFDAQGIRDDFRYTAYWNPSLISDTQGKAQARFKLPDNLTTFRCMALAQSASSQFGQSETKFEVAKPLLLQSSCPETVRLKDHFQGGVVVRNNSSQSLSVKVTAQSEGLKLSGDASQTVQLAAGKEQEVLFDLQAAELRDGKLTFQVEGGDYRDSLALPIAVHQSVVLENVSSSGSTESSTAAEMVVPSPMAAGTGVLRLWLSSTALVGLENSLEAVFDNDYVGLELLLSKVRTAVVAKGLGDALDTEEQPIKTWLDETSSYVVSAKGFRPFRSWGKVDPYLTAYALDTFALAKEAGYEVDRQSLDAGRALMKEFLNHPEEYTKGWSSDDIAVARCYALYALSRGDFDGLSYFNNLLRNRLDLPLEARVYLLLAGRQLRAGASDIAGLEDSILNAAKVEASTAYFAEKSKTRRWTFDSQTKLTALALEALLGSSRPYAGAEKVVTWLMEKRDKKGHWGDSHDDARVLQALGAYFKAREKDSPDFTATAFLDKHEIQKSQFKGRTRKNEQSTTPIASNTDRLALAIQKAGKGRLYYQLRLSYAPEKPAPARDEGLVVLKKISTLDGKTFPVSLKAGETYKVTLTVVSPQNRRFVVVRDPIPAGCDVVQTQFETESAEMSRILAASQARSEGSATFGQFERYSDRVDLFADGLQAGEHTFQYMLRANQPGTFQMPSTLAEEMYHPEVFGTTLGREVKITR